MYKRPLPINRPPPPPPPPPSSQQPAPFVIPRLRKKIHFSTSRIEYRLQEIKKIKTKHGHFHHTCNDICKSTR